jgi:outer membrane protein assembly factor BamB
MFIGTMGNEVVCVDGKGLTRVWAYENPRQQFPYFSSAAVVDDLVLIGGRDKLLHAIDQKSGKARWTFPTRGKVDSSPVVASGRVYFGSADGTIYGVDLTSGQKQWEYVVGSPVVAAPVAVSGRLLVGDQDGTLYCFGKP